tara:strand:+ start:1540 stop:1788 length:249 start_codon:yes stop_codon:yes gene_type:complete
MIKLLFFASIKEQLGKGALSIDYVANESLLKLTERLIDQQSDAWQLLLEPETVVSCNQRISSRDHIVSDGDEIAFFPPVTGG